jgi:hypothetical protein
LLKLILEFPREVWRIFGPAVGASHAGGIDGRVGGGACRDSIRAMGKSPGSEKGGTVNGDFNWIANFIWGIADDVLRDLYVRGKYRAVPIF